MESDKHEGLDDRSPAERECERLADLLDAAREQERIADELLTLADGRSYSVGRVLYRYRDVEPHTCWTITIHVRSGSEVLVQAYGASAALAMDDLRTKLAAAIRRERIAAAVEQAIAAETETSEDIAF